MTTPALGTNVCCQVGLIVRDIEKSAKLYADILGLPLPNIIITDPEEKAHTKYRGKPTQAQAKLAFFQMGPQMSIELIEPMGAPSTWQEFLDEHGEGIHHLAFVVKGMDEKLAYLESKGIPTVQRGDYTGGRYGYADAGKNLHFILELLENMGQ
jgi:catechol 2,3-dioxygenase-like lactoylglutathione lyase family enzyme